MSLAVGNDKGKQFRGKVYISRHPQEGGTTELGIFFEGIYFK
ncbi:hypothetical protein VCRA2119O147_870008 [Vibrio crassostreae]|nr:hypothetical protein VCRA2118O144_110017 [Vibrio crassostreae]CAK1749190.1 hypothetical protein VCRA2113O137_130017 [Vibrio crassostreae]CAK1837852.1 hypothetical protein VCRA2112O187_170016 [Vibrio crassostreae]CAK1982070.1 hypothetical protein VCRA2113O140_20018 [Vibrio crassostreae]CAK1982209.1 hypothetical protein VCRA2119O145_20251 [Vibrio crassostreae]